MSFAATTRNDIRNQRSDEIEPIFSKMKKMNTLPIEAKTIGQFSDRTMEKALRVPYRGPQFGAFFPRKRRLDSDAR